MEKIYCYIKVTPFVMRYLNINFGAKNPHVPNAISLKKDKILSHMLRTMLSKQSHRYDNRTLGYRYTNRSMTAAIELDEVTFSVSGFSLSPTDEAAFALFLERRCYVLALSFLHMRYIFNPNLNECIEDFQNRYGFTEDTWPTDSIRRIWYRDKSFNRSEFRGFINTQIDNILIVQMRRLGLISTKGQDFYEEHQN